MGNDKRREVTNRIISLLEQTDISQGYPNLYQRIKEWIDEIPTEKAHDGDLVSRKEAIDALMSLPRWVMTDNGEFQPVDAQTMSMIDPDDAINAIENLQTTIPDIIYCRECKYGIHSGCGDTYLCNVSPELVSEHCGDFFCGYAEGKRDELLD